MGKAVVFALASMACANPVYADQPANPQTSAQFGVLRRAQQANPYSKLFEVREALTEARQPAMGAPRKKIVCGMTIIEADPFFDQKMKVTPPKDPNLRYMIRAVPPPVCASDDR